MGQFGKMIASSGSLALMYAERLLNGVTADKFARFARPGGVVMQSNHPAFVFGHLSTYPARALDFLGRPTPALRPPADWEPLFKNGAECRDDADGKIYPPMASLTKFFFDSSRTGLAALAEADDALLAGPNPTEGRMRELFPMLGSMLIFYFDGHVQSHLGQVSAWRRAIGLPAA